MAYCDYEFYTTEYFGNQIAEADFPRLIDRASDKLDFITMGNIKRYSVDEEIEKKVKKSACSLAEILNEIETYEKASRESVGFEQTENGMKGKVITSMSSGSESVSFSTTGVNNSLVGAVLTDKTAQNKLFYDTVRDYLSGTGLLYAGL